MRAKSNDTKGDKRLETDTAIIVLLNWQHLLRLLKLSAVKTYYKQKNYFYSINVVY